MEYTLRVNNDWMHFTYEGNVFSFFYFENGNFLFFEHFKINGADSSFSDFLSKNKEFVSVFELFFKDIFSFGEKKGYLGVFTSLMPYVSFGLSSFKTNLRFLKLDSDEKKLFNKISPILSKQKTYHYHDFKVDFIKDILTSMSLLHYHVLSDMKKELSLFDFDNKTKEFFCSGYRDTLFYRIKKDGLYLVNDFLKNPILITKDSQRTKEKLIPVFKELKNKGRISYLLNDEYYFAHKYFKENYPILKNSKPYFEMLEILSTFYSKYDIEISFWEKLNLYKTEINMPYMNNFDYHFTFKEHLFVLNFRENTLEKIK